KADVDGYVIGVRYYKDANNTGTHTGSLWSSTGTLLATTTFANETVSGWQNASFAVPVAISANTIYVISYHTDTGHYAGDINYFTASGVDNGVLHAPSSAAAGGNGVFLMGPSGFPTSVYYDNNYWVDVLFATTGTVPPPPPPPPPSGSGSGNPAPMWFLLDAQFIGRQPDTWSDVQMFGQQHFLNAYDFWATIAPSTQDFI